MVIVLRWSVYEHRWVTSRQLVETGGFLGIRISFLPLERVSSVTFRQSPMGRLLGYSAAVIHVVSKHHPLAVVRYIAAPSRFERLIVEFDAAYGMGVVDEDDEGGVIFIDRNYRVRDL